MSSPIWTPAALLPELVRYAGSGWRLVEAQHIVSTLKLVDTLDEQAALEEILERTKPVVPPECRHLSYLLSTPFRYGAAYPHGSRFRRAGKTPGVWYGSERVETAVAEIAFYRILFFAESPATPWPDGAAGYTAFAALLQTGAALDLTAPPLVRDAAAWTRHADYSACQALADAAREAGAAILRFRSVRDPAGNANLAVLSCAAFAHPAPRRHQNWRIRIGRFGAQAIREHPAKRLAFRPEDFAGDPRLAGMAWDRDTPSRG